MAILAGIDIGGTFTDVVALDTVSGEVTQAKVPSTPPNLAEGFFDGLEDILKATGASSGDVERLVHGTTVATNTILEGRGAKAGLLTTKGFEDVLIIGRQFRSDMYGLFYDPETPTFVMPRRRLMGVRERLDSGGNVLTPLNEQDVADALKYLVENEGVETVAVCYLFSFLDPSHEKRTLEIAQERYPHLSVSLSSTVIPRFREYERTVVTALDAYVKPVMGRYLRRLSEGLQERRVFSPFQVMQSRGGITSAEICAQRPVITVLSGPSAGLAGGMFVGELSGFNNLITLDMGGTSCDVALVRGGLPYMSLEGKVGKYPLRQAMLDINTIGAGGGSIARVDVAGGIKVGPASAGAAPGPACYDKGGEEPTVTDANVVLGYLNPGGLAGGVIPLSTDLARSAIEANVASKLGMGVEESATGILKIVNNNMAEQLRLVSVYKGFHPKDFSLVALGGAGPCAAGRLIQQLGMARAIIPYTPGVLSAFGLLVANVEHEEVATFRAKTTEVNPREVSKVVSGLERTCRDRWREIGDSTEGLEVHRLAEMRYVGQAYELTVPFPEDHGPVTKKTIRALESRFHEVHQRMYQRSTPGNPIEFIAFRVQYLQKPQPRPTMRGLSNGTTPVGPRGTRQAYFEEYGAYVDTPIFDRESLIAGQKIQGPAIIEQPDSTTVVYPGQVALADKVGNLILTVD